MHTGREGTEDGIQKRIPQMLTEALICSTLETGQKQQQSVSVIFLIAILGMSRENEQMDGAMAHNSATGTSTYSEDPVLTSNAGSVSATKKIMTSSKARTLNTQNRLGSHNWEFSCLP